MTGHVEFVALGRAQPAGSKKAIPIYRGTGTARRFTGRAAVVDDAKRSKPWRAVVAAAAVDAFTVVGNADGLLDGPLALEVDFYVARPRGHYGTGRNARQLRPSAPTYPAVRPDLTKLLRALEDALTGIVWRDDAQVVTQTARKWYGVPERAEVRVDRLAGDHPFFPHRPPHPADRLFAEEAS